MKKVILAIIFLILPFVLFIGIVKLWNSSDWNWSDSDEVQIKTLDNNLFNISYCNAEFPKHIFRVVIQDENNNFIIKTTYEKNSTYYNLLVDNWSEIEYITTIDGLKCYLSPWCILYGTDDNLKGVSIEDYYEECSNNETFKKIYNVIIE